MSVSIGWFALVLCPAALTAANDAPVPEAAHAPSGSDIAWRLTGPGGGGWIESLSWDPQHSDRLYIGCDVGGFYRSDDAGRQYHIQNEGLADYFIEAVAVHPRQPQIILLATESGIHRSSNGGRSWQWIRNGFPPLQAHRFSAPIGAIAFDPLRPDVVYAGIGRPRWGKDGAGGIYRSEDAGLTWRPLHARDTTGNLPTKALINSIAILPGQSSLLLVATNEGLFRSEDEGLTWSASGEGLPHRYTLRLAVSSANPAIIYCTMRTTARDDEAFNGGVWRSDDRGRTWRSANGPGLPRRVGKRSQPAPMTSNLNCLLVDPRDANVVYAGDQAWVTAGLYKTIDGGGRWTKVTRTKGDDANMDYGWITAWGPSVECLGLSPARPDRLALGTSGHVFVSDDGGEHWQQRYCRQSPDGRTSGTGLEVTCISRIVPDPVRPQRWYYCYMDIGLLITDDGGASFRRSYQGMNNQGNCFALVVDPQKPQRLWAGTGWWARNAGDVCRSEDGGATWTVVGQPETGLPDGQVRHLRLDLGSPLERRRLLATVKGHGLYQSRDGGQHWQSIAGDLPIEAVHEPAGLLLDPSGPERITAALGGPRERGGGIYRSEDGGRHWSRANREELFHTIHDFVADPRNPQTLYLAARQAYDQKARRMYRGGLFRSDDGGSTWRQLLEDRFASAVVVHPADSSVLYAATTDHPYHDHPLAEGVLKSSDGGRTWRRENQGLSLRNVSCLAVSLLEPSLILAGTSGNSVFVGHDRTAKSGAAGASPR